MAYTRPPINTCTHAAPLQALSLLFFLAAMVAVSSSATPSAIRLELTHVDAKGGFTKHELMRRAMNRTRLRAAMLQGMQHADGTTEPKTPFTTYSHILSTAHISHEEYLMELAIGANPPFSAGADTGSDLIWIEQGLCSPNPAKASIVPCCSNMCKRVPKDGVPCSSECRYKISYGGGTFHTEGLMRNENLILLSNTARKPLVHIPGVAIGCSSSTTPREEGSSSKGIVGLGRGPQSLLAQLGFGKFSYCLNTYSKLHQPSALLFGAVPDLTTGCSTSGAAVATTPLLQLHHDPSKYYVHLEGISIGGVRLKIPEEALEPYGKGAGNMFIDTGCSYSNLAKKILDAIANHMDNVAFLTRRKDRNDCEVCYQISQDKRPREMPDMVLHFAEGADMNLKWEQYTCFLPMDEEKDSCLAFNCEWDRAYSVLGNFQQHNTHMLIDTIEGSVSFVPADCSKI